MSIFSKLRVAANKSRQANAAVMSQQWDGGRESRAEKVQMSGAVLSVAGATSFMLTAMANQAASIKGKFPDAPFANDALAKTLQGAHDALNSLGTLNFSDGSSVMNAALIAAGAMVAGLVVMIAKDAPDFKIIQTKLVKQILNPSDAGVTEKMAANQKMTPDALEALRLKSERASNAYFDAMGPDFVRENFGESNGVPPMRETQTQRA